MTNYIISFLVIIIFFISCEPEEIPINIDGIINYVQIDLGPDYCSQKYYDIDDDLLVSQNLITDWDIAFSNQENTVKLNSAKYMRVIEFESIVDFQSIDNFIANNEWAYDNPNGDLELQAFHGDLGVLSKNFFLIDYGYDCLTNHLGYSIIQIIDYTENSYFVQKIDIDDNNNLDYNEIIEIEKNTNHNFTYYSLINNSFFHTENESWDLCFSRYTEFNVLPPGGSLDPLPTYRVVGVLQNSNISVAVDSINHFTDINIGYLDNYEFHFQSNSIGYDWKYYNADLGIYSINSPVYIIHTSDNNYYKLLFLDFYNEIGDKGSPSFQVEKL